MKNILYLHAGAELYGADIVLLELLKNLDKSKFKPYVVLPCNGPLVEKLKENKIEVEVINYPILRRKYFNIAGILNYTTDYLKYSKKINEIVKEKKIDIVHINTAAVLEGIYIKKKTKTPLVWHIHEIIVKPKFMHKFISYLISKNADEVITVSNAVKSHLEYTGYFNKGVKVIYNGVDNDVYSPKNESDYIREELNIPRDVKIVGMVGRINSWKGQYDFLKALDVVLDKHCNVYAMLVGGVFEGEEWRIDELKNIIEGMKHKDRVVFSDYRKDIKNIHSLYDIFVLPSTNPDPLPTVVLESMASGNPVVGYKHGGVCEMVKDGYNGLLANVGDTNDLAYKIDKILSDKKLEKSMGENSLSRQLKTFSLRSYIKSFEKIYEEI